jgi:hypothetical protein
MVARDELRTTAGDTAFVVIPLADENGVGLEAVRLGDEPEEGRDA